ncbi:MAG: GNAT family N-acetyltransferase, partial [Bacteroidales bacterium]|nr:GNAT family N-acetyltransferase [Bacteroidales bacterium]
MEIIRCYENEYPALVEIWERSVKATHAFLSDEDFNKIKKALIPNYFPKVNLYALTDSERITGFIGLSSNSIEMLFIDDSYRGKGYGSALIDFALKQGA